jgi:hypothetical protein
MSSREIVTPAEAEVQEFCNCRKSWVSVPASGMIRGEPEWQKNKLGGFLRVRHL